MSTCLYILRSITDRTTGVNRMDVQYLLVREILNRKDLAINNRESGKNTELMNRQTDYVVALALIKSIFLKYMYGISKCPTVSFYSLLNQAENCFFRSFYR